MIFNLPTSEKSDAEKSYREGLRSVLDLIAPADFIVNSNYLQLNQYYVKTLFVYTYPRYLYANWLSPVITYDVTMDMSMFVYPVESRKALEDLKSRIGQMESAYRIEREKGLVSDPELETAMQDVEGLRFSLQKGEVKLFKFSLYFTIFAKSPEELDTVTQQLETHLGGKLIYTKPAYLQMEEGFLSTLPLGIDAMMITQNLDTGSISSTFPFVSTELTSNEGILYGINRHNNSLVLFDRYTLENANMVVFGKSGGGKSIAGDEPILIKDKKGTRLEKIGPLVEKLIQSKGKEKIDKDLEGVIEPKISVYAFNKNLKTEWSKVSLAARKKAPKNLWKFTTKSGREITTTSDHNMLVLKNGKVVVEKSNYVKEGNYIPLSRKLDLPKSKNTALNLLELLQKEKRVYILGAEKIISQNYSKLRKIDPEFDRYLYKYRVGRRIPLSYFLKIIQELKFSLEQLKSSNLFIISANGKNKLPVFWKMTKEFWKLLGYIISEGTITERAIIITNSDPEIIKDIEKCFKKLGLSCYQTKSAIVCTAKVFVGIINKLDLGRYSHNKKVPNQLFNIPKNQMAEFIKGYFEGDGWTEKNQVAACSKSKNLISQLSYLLLYFGIVSRIRKVSKKATNGKGLKKNYWVLTISGQENVKKFTKEIGFVSSHKNQKLKLAIAPYFNTNVDVIPETDKLITDIYQALRPTLFGLHNISPLKRKIYKPSQGGLQKLILQIEKRIKNLQRILPEISYLNSLPKLEEIIENGGRTKENNRLVWKELGASWNLMKKQEVNTGTQIALKTNQLLSKTGCDLEKTKSAMKNVFKVLDLPLNLQPATFREFLHRRIKDTNYYKLQKIAQYAITEYTKMIDELSKIKPKLELLKTLSDSDLFWDPVVKIERIQNNDKYVYDLTIDNEVFLAGFGGMFVHNSYAVKLEAIRSLMWGTDVIVIDPEDEYRKLAEAVGGSYIEISVKSKQRINPFDLPPIMENETGEDVLREAVVSVHGLVNLMVGGLTPEEDAILDKALFETYALKDITTDPVSHKNPPPLLLDLYNVLKNMRGMENVVFKLSKYIEGSFAGLFSQPTNVDLGAGFIDFSIRNLEDELRPVGMYLVLNYIWARVKAQVRRRMMIVDEAWWMMQYEDSAKFLSALCRRARKYYLGITIISQDVEDFLTNKYGKTIVTNSSLQLLLKQSQASVEKVTDVFNLTEGEKYLILEADVGEGLFFAGLNHVAIKVIASYTEDQIITSDPKQLLAMRGVTT